LIRVSSQVCVPFTMIYQSNHQAPTMSSTKKTSPRLQHRNLQAFPGKCARTKRANDRTINDERCKGRCRVQWSEKHVKEGLVLVQETQLAKVVKTEPITERYEIDPTPFARWIDSQYNSFLSSFCYANYVGSCKIFNLYYIILYNILNSKYDNLINVLLYKFKRNFFWTSLAQILNFY